MNNLLYYLSIISLLCVVSILSISNLYLVIYIFAPSNFYLSRLKVCDNKVRNVWFLRDLIKFPRRSIFFFDSMVVTELLLYLLHFHIIYYLFGLLLFFLIMFCYCLCFRVFSLDDNYASSTYCLLFIYLIFSLIFTQEVTILFLRGSFRLKFLCFIAMIYFYPMLSRSGKCILAD